MKIERRVYMKIEELNEQEKYAIACFEKVLQNRHINSHFFSFGVYADQKICLEKNSEGIYVTYLADDGVHRCEEYFLTIDAVLKDFIGKCAETVTETEEMFQEYQNYYKMNANIEEEQSQRFSR